MWGVTAGRSRRSAPSAALEPPPGGAAVDREEAREGNGERERGGKGMANERKTGKRKQGHMWRTVGRIDRN